MAPARSKLLDGYVTQQEVLDRVRPEVQAELEIVRAALLKTPGPWLSRDSEARIDFALMGVSGMERLMKAEPRLAVLFAQCANLPNRAMMRELGFELHSYAPKLTSARRRALSTALIAMLAGRSVLIESLLFLYEFRRLDSAVRHDKGMWEVLIRERAGHICACAISHESFKLPGREQARARSKFQVDLVLRSASDGTLIAGAEVKRIEGHNDFQRREGDIRNSAQWWKLAHPQLPFGVVVYHPHPANHAHIAASLLSVDAVDAVCFASEDPASIDAALRSMLAQMRLAG